MKMKWISKNQPIVDLNLTASHNLPGPFRMVVQNFPRYQVAVNADPAHHIQSLPILEIIRLVVTADFIVESFKPGFLPILGVKNIGHADFDAQRGRAFEQSISEARALSVERVLRARVTALSWVFNPATSPLSKTKPLVDSIDWTRSGVGATAPAPENVRRHLTPANMTEADRKLNRRVEIILEPGNLPVPTPGSTELNETIEAALRRKHLIDPNNPPPGPPGPPIPPGPDPQILWHLPERKDRKTFLEMVKEINDDLGFLDVDTILGSIVDNIRDPSIHDWTDDFLQEWNKLEAERRQRSLQPRLDPL